jgi:hypothetical protein
MKTTIQLKAVLFFVIGCMIFTFSLSSCMHPAAKSTTDTTAAKPKQKPIASPRDSVSGVVAGDSISINYGSPSVKGRVIWGKLVPYDTVWRTGANEATRFTTKKDIMVEGKKLPAGTYGFFAIPTPTKWTIIFNSVPNQWGAFKYDKTKDVLRVMVTPKASAMTERLVYAIDASGFSFTWDKLTVPVTIK